MQANGQTVLAVRDEQKAAVLEQVVIQGDLSKLSPTDRVLYYRAVCESVGLNPLTKPFDYLNLNNKLVLYANRTCADQLRANKAISVTRQERQITPDGLCIVTVYGQDKDGRQDVATGAVSVKGLQGDSYANAIMKAETKAKRRLALSLAGLGWLDETEVETIPAAARVDVDHETGEIKNVTPPPAPEKVQAARAAQQKAEQPKPNGNGKAPNRAAVLKRLRELCVQRGLSEMEANLLIQYVAANRDRASDLPEIDDVPDELLIELGKQVAGAEAATVQALLHTERVAFEARQLPMDGVPEFEGSQPAQAGLPVA